MAAWLHPAASTMLPRDAPEGVDSESTRSALLYGFMGSFFPVAFVTIFLRLYSRWRFTHIGKDDVLMVLALVLYIGLVIATIFAMQYGLGHHIWTISEESGVLMQKCGFSSQVLYPPSLGAVKVAIVLFFIRCLPAVHDRKNFLYGLVGFICVEQSAFTVALFLQCRPINYYWDKTVDGRCFDQPTFYYVDASFNLATDIVILCLPWVLFRKLNVSRRQKYTVVALCSLGIFTLISSLLRLPYLHNLNQSTDPTWSVPNIVIWSIAELGSAITLSSIPAIRPLYAHVFQNRGKKNTSSSESGGTNPELPIPQPRRARAANIPFTIGTIGSIVDRSLGRSRARASSSESGHQLEAGVAASVAESRHSGRDGAQDSTFSKP